jgi:hypothetical protein
VVVPTVVGFTVVVPVVVVVPPNKDESTICVQLYEIDVAKPT